MSGCDVARDPVTTMPAKPVPPYGRRAGLVPRRQEDFGGGGAFPEVHVAQYPLSMGLPGYHEAEAAPPGSSDVLAENAAKIVYSSHGDLVPRIIAPAPDHQDAAGADDDEDELVMVEATTARTRAALQAIIDARLSAVQPRSRRDDPTTLVKYRPARQSAPAAFNSGAAERIVRVEHAQEDPVLPPKHRRRRVPRPVGGSSPPATVMHSPPRPVSRKDVSDWKVPPSVSDWKNAGGYCIPLDKRVAAAAADGGRRMQEDVQVSDGFAGLSEALCVAEQKAREAIQTRAEVVTALKTKAAEQHEQKLREIANRARAEMASADAAAAPPPPVDAEQRMQRNMVREERRRERRREASSGKKSRITTRDMDRDVSERIALGMASTGGGAGAGAGEVAYDERLFNQDAGMDSGFAADDQYSVYSGRLFAAQPAALSMLCNGLNKHGDDSDVYGDADEHVEKIARTGRFRPDKVFSGALERPAVGKRGRPVEFDMPEEGGEADDPFVELDQYMAKVKEGKKHSEASDS